MINFKDFNPEIKEKGGFFKMPAFEQLSDSLSKANQWIAEEQVEVVNIETVVLPNIYDAGEEGTSDVQLRTSGDSSAYWHQFIRVWYKSI